MFIYDGLISIFFVLSSSLLKKREQIKHTDEKDYVNHILFYCTGVLWFVVFTFFLWCHRCCVCCCCFGQIDKEPINIYIAKNDYYYDFFLFKISQFLAFGLLDFVLKMIAHFFYTFFPFSLVAHFEFHNCSYQMIWRRFYCVCMCICLLGLILIWFYFWLFSLKLTIFIPFGRLRWVVFLFFYRTRFRCVWVSVYNNKILECPFYQVFSYTLL